MLSPPCCFPFFLSAHPLLLPLPPSSLSLHLPPFLFCQQYLERSLQHILPCSPRLLIFLCCISVSVHLKFDRPADQATSGSPRPTKYPIDEYSFNRPGCSGRLVGINSKYASHLFLVSFCHLNLSPCSLGLAEADTEVREGAEGLARLTESSYR